MVDIEKTLTPTLRSLPEGHVSTDVSGPSTPSSPSPASSLGRIHSEPVFYPEGGLQAWLVVFGVWCASGTGMAMMNTIASFQAHLTQNQLKDYSESEIGWIFSVFVFLAFAGGLVVGPAFDKHGPKWFMFAGSLGMVGSMMGLGSCTEYWQFMLDFGVLAGISTSLLFTPAIASIGHWFGARRGVATGLASTGGAIGGVAFPLILEALIPRIGFGWTCRIIGFIFIVLCTAACLLIRSRLPPSPSSSSAPDFKIFLDPAFTLTVTGIFLVEWALFIPLSYITSYALYEGFDSAFSFQVLTIVNVGSIFGRLIPGFLADRLGRFNTMLLTLIFTIFTIFVIWLPFGASKPGLIIFALLFGFAGGSGISLTPVCVSSLCKIGNYGRYYATCYTVVSIGCLTGIPLAGEIINSNGGAYWGLIVFTGGCYVGALVALLAVRVLKTGWVWRVIY